MKHVLHFDKLFYLLFTNHTILTRVEKKSDFLNLNLIFLI